MENNTINQQKQAEENKVFDLLQKANEEYNQYVNLTKFNYNTVIKNNDLDLKRDIHFPLF